MWNRITDFNDWSVIYVGCMFGATVFVVFIPEMIGFMLRNLRGTTASASASASVVQVQFFSSFSLIQNILCMYAIVSSKVIMVKAASNLSMPFSQSNYETNMEFNTFVCLKNYSPDHCIQYHCCICIIITSK